MILNIPDSSIVARNAGKFTIFGSIVKMNNFYNHIEIVNKKPAIGF